MLSTTLSACICVQVIVACYGAALPECLQYAGVGYNIVRGNPDGNFWAQGGDDPGLMSTKKILKLSSVTAVPNEVVYEHHDACRSAHEFSFFSDPKSYQSKLLERVSSTGTNNDALVSVAFSLSPGAQAVEQQTRRDFYTFQDDQMTCTSGQVRYKDSLSQGNHYGFSDEFAAAVCKLPLQYDQAVYKSFIEMWGTHVVEGVECGTKTVKRYLSPVKDFVEFVMANSSRDVSVGGSFMNHASSLVVDINAYKYRSQYRTVVGQLEDTFTVGSAGNPDVIGTTLMVISDLLDTVHWQHIDDYKKSGLCPPSSEAALPYWKTNLEQALSQYGSLVGAKSPVSSPVAIPVTWPEGTYSLAKPTSGCPAGDFTWYEGWRLQDTETQTPDNAWSTGNHFAGTLAKGQYTLEFCTKGEKNPTDFDRSWPKGDYCIFKYGDCPANFAEGWVKWDDEDSLNTNDWQGVLPDGVYDEDTIQRYCCRSDGMPTEPIVLPTDQPFYMFQGKREVCQKVANMQVSEEWLRFDDEDFKTPSNSAISDVHPAMEFWNQPTGASGSEIYYCYYSPQK